MKKNIAILLSFCMSYFVIAQETKTVESIYDNYINAIGGKEKIKGIANILQYSKSNATSRMESNISGQNTEFQSESNSELIYFEDLILNQKVFMTKSGKYYNKLIGYDGKTYMEDNKGKRTEIGNDDTAQQSTIFIGSEIKPNSKVSIDIYNTEKVYIIKYQGKKTMTNIISVDVYEFFSVKTGLLLAFKQVTTMEKNIQSVMITNFSDYKEVQGILIPHTSHSTATTKTDNSRSETKVKTLTITELNIDQKDFQENCFKKPEKCFKNYSSK